MQKITYIIIDDEPFAHDGIKMLMEQHPNFICVGDFMMVLKQRTTY